MISFLLYLLKSTISLGIFHLLFRLLMRRDTNFAVNRGMLLALVAASVIVPLVQLPQMLQSPVKVELIPEFSQNTIKFQNISEAGQPIIIEDSVSANEPIPEPNQLNLSLTDVLIYVYLGGVMLSFLLFARSILIVLLIFRKATVRQMNGYRLFIIDREIPSFAFGKSVVISQPDYELHGDAILSHEKAHIRLNHFYDLIFLELIKIFHWFNPAIYALTGDMKEIQEFQADEQTVGSGVDATQYQLLIIQKGVGSHRFALANSFNHCQIKKRIIMMNKSKTSKAWRWKVATFLPLLALLLMAFGKTGENAPIERMIEPPMLSTSTVDSIRIWEIADFDVFYKKDKEKIFFENKVLAMIQIDANSNVSIDDNKVSLDELSSRVKKRFDYKFADQEEWIHFQKITVNGMQKMSSMAVLAIRKDPGTKQTDFLKLLNVVANTILQIRGDYSQEIFGNYYQKITATQRKEIDKLIPMSVVVTDAILKKFEIAPPPPPPVKKEKVNALPPPPPPTIITVNKEGLYLGDNKMTINELNSHFNSLESSWGKLPVILRIDEGVPQSTIKEISEKLENVNVVIGSTKTQGFPKEINIIIDSNSILLNTYNVTTEQLLERITKLSADFYGVKVSISLNKNYSESNYTQVLKILDQVKANLKAKNKPAYAFTVKTDR